MANTFLKNYVKSVIATYDDVNEFPAYLASDDGGKLDETRARVLLANLDRTLTMKRLSEGVTIKVSYPMVLEYAASPDVCLKVPSLYKDFAYKLIEWLQKRSKVAVEAFQENRLNFLTARKSEKLPLEYEAQDLKEFSDLNQYSLGLVLAILGIIVKLYDFIFANLANLEMYSLLNEIDHFCALLLVSWMPKEADMVELKDGMSKLWLARSASTIKLAGRLTQGPEEEDNYERVRG